MFDWAILIGRCRLAMIGTIVCLYGCAAHSKGEGAKTAILLEMSNQERAWNQGDLEGFMQPYWKSDSLLFIGSRGPSYGWETTLDNYRKDYPNAEAMGQLTFEVESLDLVSEDIALMVGAWTLGDRGEREDLSGWFSLVWRQIDERWVIVRDHSS